MFEQFNTAVESETSAGIAGGLPMLYFLNPENQVPLNRAGDLIEINVSEDPHFHVGSDRLA